MENQKEIDSLNTYIDGINPFNVITKILYEHIDHSKSKITEDGLYLKVTNQAAINLFDLIQGVHKEALIAELKEQPDEQLENMVTILFGVPEMWGKVIHALVNSMFLVTQGLVLKNEEDAYNKLLSYVEIYQASEKVITKQ